MTFKFIVIAVSLTLTACSGPAKKVAETDTQPVPISRPIQPSPPLLAGSVKAKIVDAATEEWIFFGQQKVVIEKDDESIPHVGHWEDDDWPHIDRVNQYWRTVGMDKLSGTDCKEPWSAAFISWVMQTAGVPASMFPPATAHRVYVSHIIANAKNPDAMFIPHPITEYRPKPGDMICANRGSGYFGDVVEEVPQTLNAKLHCDIVVQNDGRTLQAIGGNVRNSVSKTLLTLSPEGYLQLAQHRPWFLVIENRLE